MREILIAFTLGALLAGAGVFFYISWESQQFRTIFEGAEAARASTRAKQAYQHEEPAIAVWELRHLADLQTEELRKERVATNEIRAGLMMTRARLAKLYNQQGREAEAQTNANIAIRLLNEMAKTNPTVTNLATLLEHIQRSDAKAKQEPRYE